ncbi:MAG: alginate O-acetyltransferase complex protein AlgI [Flavobacteriaceae bacterium]|jgi:alginate O-acetyltransferase complex protein AlgI
MLFSSLTFLFQFPPAAYCCVLSMSEKRQEPSTSTLNCALVFLGGVNYSPILIVFILVNFLFVERIQKAVTSREIWLVIGVIFNLGLIARFKYLDFFIGNINGIAWLLDNN